MKRLLFALAIPALFTTVPQALGCPQPPGYGFVLELHDRVYENGVLILDIFAIDTLSVRWQRDAPGAAGDTLNDQKRTNLFGRAFFSGMRTPAYYRIIADTGGCTGMAIVPEVLLNPSSDPVVVACSLYRFFFNAIPSSFYTYQSADLILTGSGVDTTYGQPVVEICDLYGSYIWYFQQGWAYGSTQVNAYGVYPTTAGNYSILVRNAEPGGTFGSMDYLVGGSPTTVYP